ncbi:MAG: hypothetical protein ABEJ66_01790, partial [Candidatus Nanohaloarchaea archaeon]
MKHGIKLDIEFLAIVLGAAAVAYLVSGQLVSNALFTALVTILFFLMGLHLDLDKLKKSVHHVHEVGLGMAIIYLFSPLLAFGVARFAGGPVADAFTAIGVSAAS